LYSSCTCHEGIRGSGVIFPLILNIGAEWRQVVSFMPWLFCLLIKNLQYLLHWRMGGPHSSFGQVEEEEDLIAVPGFEAQIV